MKFKWAPPPSERSEECWCTTVTLREGELINLLVSRYRAGWMAAFRRTDLGWYKIPLGSQTATGKTREGAAGLLVEKLERERPVGLERRQHLASTIAV